MSAAVEFGRRAALRLAPARCELPLRSAGTKFVGWLEPELEWLDELAAPGVAVDIGASYGLYSYGLIRRGHPVVAFEPQPWCADTLRRWARRRATIYEVGLSDASGVMKLNIPHDRGRRYTGHASFEADTAPGESLPVPVQTLDAFALEGVTFMKIDVEGHEMHVLRGARETLDRLRPVLLVEVNAAPLTDAEVAERFGQICGYGYRGKFLHDGRWRSLESYDVQRFQRDRLNGDADAPYVCNFVFRPVDGSAARG